VSICNLLGKGIRILTYNSDAIIGGLIKKFRRLSLSVEMKVPVEFGDHNTAMLSAASLQHTVDQGASDSK